jgi:alkylhydroperoxidase family enzyme
MTENPARIPPRPAEEWDSEVLDALSVMRSRRIPGGGARRADPGQPAQAQPAQAQPAQAQPAQAQPANIIATYAWHPALAKGWLTFTNHIFQSALPDRMRELVTLRTTWVRRAEYEWAQHVRLGQAVGLSSSEIDAISVGPSAEQWGPLDAALLRSVDEICRDRYISDATWDELASQLSRQQLMDLVFTIGAYDLLAVVFKTFGVGMDPGLQGFGPQGSA